MAAAAREGTSARDQARAQIVAGLYELGVPTRVKLLGEYIAARWDTTVDSRAVSDVRRGEQRRFDRNQGGQGPYVSPALEAVWCQPITKTLTLVEWPLARRIIGPWSERADHLQATRCLAERLVTEPNRAVQALTLKMARSIDGAIDGPFDAERVGEAAAAELVQIGAKDEAWRTEAAARAAITLSPAEQRWGVTNLEEDDE